MADELSKQSVGKGNPPKATQFAKVKSGNPKGRRKGKSNKRTIVQKVALEEHTVIENGPRKKTHTSRSAVKGVAVPSGEW